jgi:UDP-glucose 4-epimerase
VKVANRELPCLNVFGNDYDTPDGTGVRDYIHVVDLSKGHIKALDVLFNETGIDYYNLGTGQGYSVLDLIKTFERVNKVTVPYQIVGRRDGDIAECYADPSYSKEKLHWESELDLDSMLKSAYDFWMNHLDK